VDAWLAPVHFDAAVLASELPTAMLFVRNPTGVSHSPYETASDEDCRAGVDALTAALAVLAGAGWATAS
jgi:beta-ureidopropionase / N-carbamoyl-L-amino-acid hydrolase